MARNTVLLAACACIGLKAPPARAAKLTDAVIRNAIATLSANLCARQRADGSWPGTGYPVGCTALVLLALNQAELAENRLEIQRAKRFLLENRSRKTYAEALVLCALERWARQDQVRARLETAARNLVAWQARNGGWTYVDGSVGTQYDFSNTQFALLGLAAARRMGVGVGTDQAMARAKKLWLWAQNRDGGWGYRAGDESTASMSCAAVASLYLFGMRLERPGPKCGQYVFEPAMVRGLRLIRDRVRNDQVYGPAGKYVPYAWYALERVAMFLGLRSFGGVDWYRAGAGHAMRVVQAGGSVPDQAFTLLFLAKAATPLAVAKWQWRGDWNNDHADAANWVTIAAERLDAKLDWLPTRLDGNPSPAAKASLIFVNGHGRFRLREHETAFLRRFLRAGGTVVAEACCNSDLFRRTFREEMERKLYPGVRAAFRRVPADHPLYHAWVDMDAERMPVLQYARSGCRRKRLFLLGSDISCSLNGEKTPDGDRNELARGVALNLLVYAMAHKTPMGKLDRERLPEDAEAPSLSLTADEIDYRGSRRAVSFRHPLGRLKHRGDWLADPLFFSTLDAASRTVPECPVFDGEVYVDPTTDDLFNVPVLFVNGHDDPGLSDPALAALRLYLQNGGVLLASSCCSSPRFDRGFRKMIARALPNDALERIPSDDAIMGVPIPLSVRRAEGNATYRKLYRTSWAPIYGIRREGRWAVLYSPVDFCCALEGDVSDEGPMYERRSALDLVTNILADAVRMDGAANPE